MRFFLSAVLNKIGSGFLFLVLIFLHLGAKRKSNRSQLPHVAERKISVNQISEFPTN